MLDVSSKNELKGKVIGICGNARSGKDTLAKNIKEILSEQNIKSQILSFADELKKSVDDFLISQIGISAFSEDSEEKKIIRPFLVCWGTEVMRSINKNVWIDKLAKNLKDDNVNIAEMVSASFFVSFLFLSSKHPIDKGNIAIKNIIIILFMKLLKDFLVIIL